ncbi:myotrophin homolog [Tubulanus polymorphus]|uniref:myotrophin homolog n=1 Tax=Tubulanus polymorphus TaxID=672921 RepID=UPI003DA1EC8C
MGEYLWAIKNGDLEKVEKEVEQLLQSGGTVNDDLESGRVALHLAADYGQKEVLEYLISKGADIDKLDKYGISPLLAAIYEGHTSCVKLLISKGAEYKSVKAPSGDSYYDCAEKDEIKALLK